MGWHNHWDELAASATEFLWDPADLIRYDVADVRNRVLSQGALDMILATRLHGLDLAAPPDFNERFGSTQHGRLRPALAKWRRSRCS